MKKLLTAAIVVLTVLMTLSPLSAEVHLKHRWVWCMHNLLVDRSADEVIALMERAKACGYTGFVLSDYKFNVLDWMGKEYFDNVERVKAKARELELDIVPSVVSIGYASGLLAHDPNLVEGHPVVDAPFAVKGGELVPVMDEGATLTNGDFEDVKDAGFAGWQPEAPGRYVARDRDVTRSGKTSVRMGGLPEDAGAVLRQTLDTEPFRAYHLSAWIRTEDFADPGRIRLNAMGRRPARLVEQDLGVKRTQDWTQHHVVFNSLTNRRVRIELDVAGSGAGKVWWDDVRLEPIGFVNVIRREACPVKVTSPDGKTPYVEGRDFDRIEDPKLGREKWAGTFAAWHTPPAVKVPEGSRLREGDRVLVSYYHPLIVLGSQVTCSLTDPKVYDIIDDQVKRVHALFAAKHYMMGYDEIRTGGWTPDYDDMTCGEALAGSVKKVHAILRKHAPDAEIWVWNDMFDPNHNAKPRGRYYLVKTPWAGSWEGLAKDIHIMDWSVGLAPKSFAFFHGRGHTQAMAGYYDGDPDANVRQWLAAAKASGADITGIMYTTWRGDYAKLEAFMEAVRKYEK